MQNEFAEFEKGLFGILEQEGNRSSAGVKAQNLRYQLNRIEWLMDAFFPVRNYLGQHFESIFETYIRINTPVSGDYGNWGDLTNFLDYIRQSHFPLNIKSCFEFYAACLAVQQLEAATSEDLVRIPFLGMFLSRFELRNKTARLESLGYLAEVYEFERGVQLWSMAGEIHVEDLHD